jgi:serine/threonine protein kinase
VPDDSGFLVGPVLAPESYELVAMLGVGGEGEVWDARVRAAGPGGAAGDRVAIAMVRHDPDDQEWTSYAQRLRSLSHPGLVRIRDAFDGPPRHRLGDWDPGGTHRYVVMDYEAGETLSQWLIGHPEASLTERTHLLRQVAAALDALHAGAGVNEPVAHGTVTPDNVIVRANGSTVLVGLGRSRETGETAIGGDALAFALMTAQSLSGKPVPTDSNGNLDTTALARQLRTSVVTRRHPALNRQLLAAVNAAPEARPRRLRPWLDGALEPQRQTVTSFSESAATEAPTEQFSPRSGRWLVGLLVALVAVSATVAVYAAFNGSDADGGRTPPHHTTTPALTAEHITWPFANKCDTSAAVAVPAQHGDPAGYDGGRDPRMTLIQRELAASWRDGHLRFTLVSHSSDAIRIWKIQSRAANTYFDAPAWVYRTVDGGCTARPSKSEHEYVYAVGEWFNDPTLGTPSHPVTDGFTLLPGESTTIDIDARSCSANREWSTRVFYTAGAGRQEVLPVGGVRRSFGLANSRTEYVEGAMTNGAMRIEPTSGLKDFDRQCPSGS